MLNKNILKQIFILLYLSILVACAGSEPPLDGAADRSRGGTSDCISSGTIRDYQVLDDANLIVTGGVSRMYHVALSRRAMGLRSSWSIGFRSTTGQICAGFGEIVVDDGMGPDRIRIASIRQLTPAELDALLVRFGKKEPEIEPAPAPTEVEGAEVEELD